MNSSAVNSSARRRPFRPLATQDVGWAIDIGRCDYARVLAWQKSLVILRRKGMIRDMLIFVEHPPVITLGKQTEEENLRKLDESIERFEIQRGGDVTYHGPGQLVCYQIFDLNRRDRDLHTFVRNLEQGIIDALSEYGVAGIRVKGLTGVWVEAEKSSKAAKRKIASIGVAANKWVSYHGVAVNLTTDLTEFARINPCGLDSEVMTSLFDLTGKKVSHAQFARALQASYAKIFETTFDTITRDVIAEDLASEEGGGHV